MKRDSDPSVSKELEHLPHWDRSFWLSRAFIEASQSLCTSMLNGEFSSQYSSSRVILHLMRHGIELFLKAAISAASGRPEDFGHNLDSLVNEYRRLYPDVSFSFEIPVRFKVDPNFELFPEFMRSFHATLDQRYRYSAGRKGEDFTSPEIFDPTSTLHEIEELDRTLKILEFTKIKPLFWGNHAP